MSRGEGHVEDRQPNKTDLTKDLTGAPAQDYYRSAQNRSRGKETVHHISISSPPQAWGVDEEE